MSLNRVTAMAFTLSLAFVSACNKDSGGNEQPVPVPATAPAAVPAGAPAKPATPAATPAPPKDTPPPASTPSPPPSGPPKDSPAPTTPPKDTPPESKDKPAAPLNPAPVLPEGPPRKPIIAPPETVDTEIENDPREYTCSADYFGRSSSTRESWWRSEADVGNFAQVPDSPQSDPLFYSGSNADDLSARLQQSWLYSQQRNSRDLRMKQQDFTRSLSLRDFYFNWKTHDVTMSVSFQIEGRRYLKVIPIAAMSGTSVHWVSTSDPSLGVMDGEFACLESVKCSTALIQLRVRNGRGNYRGFIVVRHGLASVAAEAQIPSGAIFGKGFAREFVNSAAGGLCGSRPQPRFELTTFETVGGASGFRVYGDIYIASRSGGFEFQNFAIDGVLVKRARSGEFSSVAEVLRRGSRLASGAIISDFLAANVNSAHLRKNNGRGAIQLVLGVGSDRATGPRPKIYLTIERSVAPAQAYPEDWFNVN